MRMHILVHNCNKHGRLADPMWRNLAWIIVNGMSSVRPLYPKALANFVRFILPKYSHDGPRYTTCAFGIRFHARYERDVDTAKFNHPLTMFFAFTMISAVSFTPNPIRWFNTSRMQNRICFMLGKSLEMDPVRVVSVTDLKLRYRSRLCHILSLMRLSPGT